MEVLDKSITTADIHKCTFISLYATVCSCHWLIPLALQLLIFLYTEKKSKFKLAERDLRDGVWNTIEEGEVQTPHYPPPPRQPWLWPWILIMLLLRLPVINYEKICKGGWRVAFMSIISFNWPSHLSTMLVSGIEKWGGGALSLFYAPVRGFRDSGLNLGLSLNVQ